MNNMKQTFVFIYAKDNKIKVLTQYEANQYEKELKSEGWSHKATLNPCTYIQYLCNECENVKQEFKTLLK